MAGFTPLPVCRVPRHCLFAMNGFHKLVVIILMAAFACFRADIVGISSYAALRAEEEDGNKKTK
jgi:hypothetical protein